MRRRVVAIAVLCGSSLFAQIPSDLRLTGLLEDGQGTTAFLSFDGDRDFLSLRPGEIGRGLRLIDANCDTGLATIGFRETQFTVRIGGRSPNSPLLSVVPETSRTEPAIRGNATQASPEIGDGVQISRPPPESHLVEFTNGGPGLESKPSLAAAAPEPKFTAVGFGSDIPNARSGSSDVAAMPTAQAGSDGGAQWPQPKPPTDDELFKSKYGYAAAELRDRERRRGNPAGITEPH